LYGGFNILGLDWARIYFIENDGMAFGLQFGGDIGKYILSIFRIFMVGFLIYFLKSIIRSKESFGLQISFALIIAGAIGNIIDSAFYGLIFSDSSPHSRNIAEFMPEGGGYEGFLQGKVVDMFHFPMINSRFPDWLPVWGGDAFSFFRPVFNVADSSISIGVVMILLFYRSFFIAKKEDDEEPVDRSIEVVE
jgi:signal peptidase II